MFLGTSLAGLIGKGTFRGPQGSIISRKNLDILTISITITLYADGVSALSICDCSTKEFRQFQE